MRCIKTTLELIQSVITKEKLTPGMAYAVFSCGCVFLQKQFNKKKRIFRTKNGTSRAVCPNHPAFENEYLGRYRICAKCHREEAAKKGRGFELSVCKVCNAAEWDLFKTEYLKNPSTDRKNLLEDIRNDIQTKRKKKIKYYQNGKQIKEPKKPETDPLCGNRDACLDAAGYESDSFIHCTGCPNKKSWIDM